MILHRLLLIYCKIFCYDIALFQVIMLHHVSQIQTVVQWFSRKSILACLNLYQSFKTKTLHPILAELFFNYTYIRLPTGVVLLCSNILVLRTCSKNGLKLHFMQFQLLQSMVSVCTSYFLSCAESDHLNLMKSFYKRAGKSWSRPQHFRTGERKVLGFWLNNFLIVVVHSYQSSAAITDIWDRE